MKRIMKKLIGIIGAAVIMVCNFSTKVSASTMDEEIDFETYSQVLTEAYAKEGVEIEVVYPNVDTLTRRMLKEDLDNVKKIVKSIRNSSTEELLISEEKDVNVVTQNIQPRAMYGTVTASGTKTISDLSNPLIPLIATISVSAEIYADLNNCTIIKGYEPSLSLRSATGFDDYIVLKSYSTRIDNSSSTITKHSITYTITCELKQALSFGAVTSWAKVDKTFSIKLQPF